MLARYAFGVASRKVYRPFREARTFARGLNLPSQQQWYSYAKGELEATHGLKPDDIPATPNGVYKGKGWAGMMDWLAIEEREYRPFCEARKFAQSLKLSGELEWKSFCTGEFEKTHGLKPADIPPSPRYTYSEEWAGFGDWLGTGNGIGRRPGQFRSFVDARKFVRSRNIRHIDWWPYCTGKLEATHGLKPEDIPATPYVIYNGKGWAGWSDWLRTKPSPTAPARTDSLAPQPSRTSRARR